MEGFLLSIVVPMYYEEAVAGECYKRLTLGMEKNGQNYELIFINDGSKDIRRAAIRFKLITAHLFY